MTLLRYRALLVLASCLLLALGCKARKPTPLEETATDLPAQLHAPVSKGQDFAVGDDVSIIQDDGRFDIDVRVSAVTEAPRRYTVRVGSGRASSTKSLAPSQVFPPPWASAARVRAGDTIYEIRFGNFAPSKCLVKQVPVDVHGSITASCDGATKTQSVARQDAFYAIEPATQSNVATGDIVYYDKTRWAMVVGPPQSDGRVAIRETGYGARDQLVGLSKLQRVR